MTLDVEHHPPRDIPTWSLDQIQAALRIASQEGGPLPSAYPVVEQILDRVSALREMGALSENDNDRLWEAVGKASTTASVMGLCYRAPYGYRGDFEIIDRLYTCYVNPDPAVRRWDEYAQSLDCAHAVRNRSAYIGNLIRDCVLELGTVSVLNVGSGPCRDLSNCFRSLNGSVHVTCVELDGRAIEYATSLLQNFINRVTFVQKNVLRVSYRAEFDLVWSSGLFDYLDDRQFVLALRRMVKAAKPGGKIVIGNFAPDHRSRSSIEWANWFLHNRTRGQLIDLAVEAGVPRDHCKVEAEMKRVNLFLHIHVGSADSCGDA